MLQQANTVSEQTLSKSTKPPSFPSSLIVIVNTVVTEIAIPNFALQNLSIDFVYSQYEGLS